MNPIVVSQSPSVSVRGRGTGSRRTSRFEPIRYQRVIDEDTPVTNSRVRTEFFRDRTKSIITRNLSPDVFFDASINPYRGCEHGCAYCYARPTHEYLAMSAGLDFETKILVKEDAPELLKKELSDEKWIPQVLGMSGVTDCYQPAEQEFGLTRACLEVLADFRNPVGIVTKNHCVTRDIDILLRLKHHNAVLVMLSLTTMDEDLRRRMEPRTSSTRKRLDAVRELTAAGIPCGVLVGPIVPGLTDSEIPALLESAVEAGAAFATSILLRLPYGVSELFESWLQQQVPSRAEKVMHHIRETRGGRVNDPTFGRRMCGQGEYAKQIVALFDLQCRRLGLKRNRPDLSVQSFRVPGPVQRTLF